MFSPPVLRVEQFARPLISAFAHSLFSTAPMPLIALSAFVLRCCQLVVSPLIIACLIDYLLFVEQTIIVLPAPLFVVLLIIEIEVKKSLDPFLLTNYLPPMPYL